MKKVAWSFRTCCCYLFRVMIYMLEIHLFSILWLYSCILSFILACTIYNVKKTVQVSKIFWKLKWYHSHYTYLLITKAAFCLILKLIKHFTIVSIRRVKNFFKENTRCKENVPTRRYIDRKTFNSYYVRFFVSKVWFILLYQSKYGYNINEITPWYISVLLLPSLKVKRVMEYHSAA